MRRGGTEDINIGVGELQECTMSKTVDRASTLLAQFAINGNSLGQAIIDFVEIGGTGKAEGEPFCYMRYVLDRVFIKSWSTSGDADDRPTEEVAMYYNRIGFQYGYTETGKDFTISTAMTWGQRIEYEGVEKNAKRTRS